MQGCFGRGVDVGCVIVVEVEIQVESIYPNRYISRSRGWILTRGQEGNNALTCVHCRALREGEQRLMTI